MLIINGRMQTLRVFPQGVEKIIKFDEIESQSQLLQEVSEIKIIKLFSLADEPGVFEPGIFDESCLNLIVEIIQMARASTGASAGLRCSIELNDKTSPLTFQKILAEVYRIDTKHNFREILIELSEAALVDLNAEKNLNIMASFFKNDSQVRTQINLIAPHDQRYFDFFQIPSKAQLFYSRMRELLASDPRLRLNLGVELDIFNSKSIIDVLKNVLRLNAEFKSSFRDPAISIRFVEMTRTPWWSFKLLNSERSLFIAEALDFVEKNQWDRSPDYVGFHPENITQLNSVVKNSELAVDNNFVKRCQIDFIWKISQKEVSHGKFFLEVFPELKEIYDRCHLTSQQRLENEVFAAVRDKLNQVGKGFCLAKWSNVTLHLESGNTHSCHHPSPHNIPLEELKKNSSALHNTAFKIQQRKLMVEGARPAECYYCWNIEDLATQQFSDRHIKSAEPYSMDDFDAILAKPLDPFVKPRYLEVSFSNKCNFKCSYCSADYSSSWADELKRFGPYSTETGKQTVTIYEEEDNPYIKAFWHWWPEFNGQLNTLRITGGEPLLSPNTFKLLESFLVEPNPNLNIIVNSNLGIPAVLFDKFEQITKSIYEKRAVKSLRIYTSTDAYGERAEYIRNGFKNDLFWSNVEKCLKINDEIEVHIMCTFNALSITSGPQLIKKMAEINRQFKNAKRWSPVSIDFSYLRHPEHQSIKVLTNDYIEKMNDLLKSAEENQWLSTNEKMRTVDIHQVKLRRILDWMKEPLAEEKLRVLRWRFYEFFSEHDRRRGTDFSRTFPEMSDFWMLCKNEYEQLLKQRSGTVSPAVFKK